jgi:hypothetical protein
MRIEYINLVNYIQYKKKMKEKNKYYNLYYIENNTLMGARKYQIHFSCWHSK